MKYRIAIAGLLLALSAATAHAGPRPSGPWGTAQKIDEVSGNSTELNTPSLDGCPILSPKGVRVYMASDRPGGHGGLDIWVARRQNKNQPFGAPVNLPEPINSAADDFCPTPLGGGKLMFVSRRVTDASCGLGDIYIIEYKRNRGWRNLTHLRCAPAGPNSGLDEQGPSLVKVDGAEHLYFSRSTPTVPGDIFVSEDFGTATAVSELNSPGNDIQPNVRKDGLELVLSSNHAYPGAQGGQDIYVSRRASNDDPWSTPTNLGTAINTAAAESRPSLSWDARTLLFGRTPGPEGASGIYISTR